jgi:hypothetical protein
VVLASSSFHQVVLPVLASGVVLLLVTVVDRFNGQ